MTGPIARVAASKLHEQAYPLRVGYAANVFRAQEEKAEGRQNLSRSELN